MAPVEFVVPAGRPLESLGMTVFVVALLFLASGAVVESAVFADVTARVGCHITGSIGRLDSLRRIVSSMSLFLNS